MNRRSTRRKMPFTRDFRHNGKFWRRFERCGKRISLTAMTAVNRQKRKSFYLRPFGVSVETVKEP